MPDLFVATTGSDTNDGSAGAPLATLGEALSRTTGGETITVGAGSFPLATDDRVRTGEVIVQGAGALLTHIAGLEVRGGQQLRFRDIGFTATASMQGHNSLGAAQPASHVTFERADFTSTGLCFRIRDGATNIAILDSYLHDAITGIAGPGNPDRSHDITIQGNTIERMTGDGIQFGSWDNVLIEDNLIQHIIDDTGVFHNDGIQLTGNSTGVSIITNIIFRSRTQLLFIQDAIGPIDDVTVINNLMAGCNGVGFQSQGATRATYINNTIWNAKDGGLWLRRGYYRAGGYVVPTDTTLINTIARSIAVLDGAAASTSAGNVVICPTSAPGTGCVTNMGFVGAVGEVPVTDPLNPSLERDDYRLRSDSPARPLGSAISLPALDLAGVVRDTPVPGALHRSENLPPPVLITDTFTGATGTLLTAHTADTGETYTKVVATGYDDGQITAAGRIRPSGTHTLHGAASLTIVGDHYVEADIYVAASNVFADAGVIARADVAANTCYFARLTTAGAVQLYKQIAGSPTLLGSGTQTPTVGVTYRIRLEITDTYKRVLLDDNEKVYVEENAITADGKAGIRTGTTLNPITDSLGLHVDNLAVDALDTTLPVLAQRAIGAGRPALRSPAIRGQSGI